MEAQVLVGTLSFRASELFRSDPPTPWRSRRLCSDERQLAPPTAGVLQGVLSASVHPACLGSGIAGPKVSDAMNEVK